MSPRQTDHPPVTLVAVTLTDEQQVAIRSEYLLKLWRLYQGLVTRHQDDFFPEDLTAETVRKQIVDHLEAEGIHVGAGQLETAAVKTLVKATKEANAMLVRLEKLVNSNYPPGSPKRAAFFIKGEAPGNLSERLAAMAEGMNKHALRPHPADLSREKVLELAARVAGATLTRGSREEARKLAAQARLTLERDTTAYFTRLREGIEGNYGHTSPELAAYGLKARAVVRVGGKRKKVAAPMPVPESEPA